MLGQMRLIAAIAVAMPLVLAAAGCSPEATGRVGQQSAIKYTSVDESTFWIEASGTEEALDSVSFTPPVLPQGILEGKPRIYVHDSPANARGLKFAYSDFELLIEPVEGTIDYGSIAASAPDIMRPTVVGGYSGLEQNRGVQKMTSGEDNPYPSALQWQVGSLQYTLRSGASDLPVLRAAAARLMRGRP
jgi:hypothetical protein